MILEKVISGCGTISIEGNPQVEIASICNDSRKAAAGSMFIAVKGFAIDGHMFIRTAASQGVPTIPIVYRSYAKTSRRRMSSWKALRASPWFRWNHRDMPLR